MDPLPRLAQRAHGVEPLRITVGFARLFQHMPSHMIDIDATGLPQPFNRIVEKAGHAAQRRKSPGGCGKRYVALRGLPECVAHEGDKFVIAIGEVPLFDLTETAAP